MAAIDPNAEWIGNVQPIGLVVAANVLARHGLNPAEQTRADTEAVRALLSADDEGPALPDPWAFFTQVLGWRAAQVAGAPGWAGAAGGLVHPRRGERHGSGATLGGVRPGQGLANPRSARGPRRRSRSARCARRLGGNAASAARAAVARNRRADRTSADRRRIAPHPRAARGDQRLAEVSASLARRRRRPPDARRSQADPFLVPAAQ